MYDTTSTYLQSELDYRADAHQDRRRYAASGGSPGYAAPPRRSTRANR